MPRLSVVIPAVGSIESLESTLVSVLENRPDDCEILVVLNQEYQDPYSLSGEVRFIEAERGASYIQCANRGVVDSAAPFIHLLASGCEVTEGWADAALAPFVDRRVAMVSPTVYDRLRPERMLALGVGYSLGGGRRLVTQKSRDKFAPAILGPTSLAGFFRRTAIESAAQFCESLGNLADVDLALSLQAAGWKAISQRQSRVFAGASVPFEETGFRRALCAERLFWRNVGRIGRAASLAMHPLTIFTDWLHSLGEWGGIPNAAGRLVGLATAWRHAQAARSIRAIAPENTESSLVESPSITTQVRVAAATTSVVRRIDGAHTASRSEPTTRNTRARAG